MDGAESTMVPVDELDQKLSTLRLCWPASDDLIRRSLQRHGQLTAVAAFDDGARLYLVDGFKRLRASRQLGWTHLRVRKLACDAATATAIIGVLHEQRRLTELEEGWIARALCRDHALSQGAVARLLRRHKSWVSRRLLLVDGLDETVQGDVRLGLLSPRSAVAVGALPRGNQRSAADLVMERGMTTRQAETLVRRLRELDSDRARDALMNEWPKATPSPAKARSPRSSLEQLLADVAILMRAGVRLEVCLLEATVDLEEAIVAREALAELASLLVTVGGAIRRALTVSEKMDETLANT
jgi:ParB-like chromosome segregation protein Spo0J